jgi:hypothetical protein
MNLIRLDESNRGDVPEAVTHLVEVPIPGKGDPYPAYYFDPLRRHQWYVECFQGHPSDGSFRDDTTGYRFARPAEPHEIPAGEPSEAAGGEDDAGTPVAVLRGFHELAYRLGHPAYSSHSPIRFIEEQITALRAANAALAAENERLRGAITRVDERLSNVQYTLLIDVLGAIAEARRQLTAALSAAQPK